MKKRVSNVRLVPQADWQVYALLAAATTLIRLPFLGNFDLVSFDGTYYLNQAKTLWSSAPMPGAFPVGYPFFVSLLLPVIGDAVRAGQAVSFLAGLGSLFVVFQLARACGLRRDLAFGCALVLAINPLFARVTTLTFSEPTYVFWTLFSFLWFARERYALAGVCAGVAAVTRPEILAIIAAFSLICLLRRKPRAVLIIIATSGVVYSLNVATFYVKTGELNPLSKSEFFASSMQDWREREEGAGSLGVEEEETGQQRPALLSIVIHYAKRFPSELYELARHITPVLLLLAGYGITRRRHFLWVSFLPMFAIPLFTVRSIDRYLLPYIPFAILYAFIAASEIENPRYKRWALLLIAVFALAGAVVNSNEFTKPVDEGYEELKRAGLYLAQHADPDARVADRKPYVPFYAGLEYVEIPWTSYEEAIQHLVDNDVDYLSLHLPTIKYLRPPLLSLLTHAPAVAGEFRYEQMLTLEEGYILYKKVRDKNPVEWRRLTEPEEGFDSMPDWSPDGRHIAFSSTRSGDMNIYVVPADGSAPPQLLVGGSSQEDEPAWSPDGGMLAFSSNREGNWDIYVKDTNTKEVKRITSGGTRDSSPAWSPDGRLIAYVAEGETRADIFAVDIVSGETRQLTTSGDNSYPAFSPDGTRISWTRPSQALVILDLANGRRQTAFEPQDVNYAPAWSPDGRFLAVTARDWASVDIYLTTGDGERALLLTKNARADDRKWFDALPAWSPDGERLAIVSSVDGPNSVYILSNLAPYLERLATPYRMATFKQKPVRE